MHPPTPAQAHAARRHTTFCFTLQPGREQASALARHMGAARFAFNQSLRLVLDALEARKHEPQTDVPWSGFDLINALNAWKRSAAAGIDDAGRAGLSWRHEVCQQVFEEAAVDVGRALAAFTAGRQGTRKGRRSGCPRFKRRSDARQSFRIRNKNDCIRLGEALVRSVRLPKLGVLRVRECTRKLRRMLRSGRARILFATVSRRGDGRLRIALNVEAAALPAEHHHCDATSAPAVGIDRGLTTFAVLANAAGQELERLHAPRPLRRALRRLRRRSRQLSRKVRGSRNRERARRRLARLHQRVTDVRNDFLHRHSSRLAKTHGHLVLEDLNTAGLMRTRLSRAIADSGWGRFATLLGYKVRWRGGVLTLADRFYPSTRRCSACGHCGPRLELAVRTFRCAQCGHEADRDTNAAACLA